MVNMLVNQSTNTFYYIISFLFSLFLLVKIYPIRLCLPYYKNKCKTTSPRNSIITRSPNTTPKTTASPPPKIKSYNSSHSNSASTSTKTPSIKSGKPLPYNHTHPSSQTHKTNNTASASEGKYSPRKQLSSN